MKGYKELMLSSLVDNSYIVTITDDVMQQIADALRCKLSTVTSGSKWILYNGESTKDGFICSISGINFTIRQYINGVEQTSTNKPATVVNQNMNGNSAKNFRLRYANGKNGATFFVFISDTMTSGTQLSFLISTATLQDKSNIGVYGYIGSNYRFWIDGGETYNLYGEETYGYADDYVVMTIIPLPRKNTVINGLYRCLVNKNQEDRYVFSIDAKKYLACDDQTGYGKCVIELDDNMLV